ncbi:MAG: thiamine pyrophosphate-binding protein [Pseudomonadales bacterium]
MLGRHVFMEGLVANGVTAIFGNPGTTENPLLESLADYPHIPYYVALQESIAAAAASHYSQATGAPSLVNLHVAPGLGNAIGMMFGALKAGSPVLVTAGQQDSRMRLREPLLSHDLVAMARPVTKWSAEPRHADEIAPMLREALRVAMTPPRGPVFMSMPVDVFSADTHVTDVSPDAAIRLPGASAAQLDALVDLLGSARSPAIVAGDDVVVYGGAQALVGVAERARATVYQEGLRVHATFPNRHPCFGGRVPFEAGSIRTLLGRHDLVFLIGGPFFEEIWYEPGSSLPDVPLIRLEQSHERVNRNFVPTLGIGADIGATLEALRQRLEPAAAPPTPSPYLAALDDRLQQAWGAHPMTATRAMHELSQALPGDAIVVDESITAYPDVAAAFDFAAPHGYYGARGGGIGQGIAGAIGIQAAHPGRTVVAISGDGSAMYSIQALWSAAHHAMPILFVILANREYRVLKHNLDIYRARFGAESNRPYPHMDLHAPMVDFVQTAQGHGVEGTRVDTPEAIGPAVKAALATGRPHVLELVIAGK